MQPRRMKRNMHACDACSEGHNKVRCVVSYEATVLNPPELPTSAMISAMGSQQRECHVAIVPPEGLNASGVVLLEIKRLTWSHIAMHILPRFIVPFHSQWS